MSRKRYRCETTDNRAMSLVVSWYRRGGTSVEALIPCSHEGRVLVAKGADEVENAEANSKYQDRAEAKELHKTSVNGLLIKIVKNEGLRVDARCCTFSTRGVGGKDDGEDGTIPEGSYDSMIKIARNMLGHGTNNHRQTPATLNTPTEDTANIEDEATCSRGRIKWPRHVVVVMRKRRPRAGLPQVVGSSCMLHHRVQ
ncbi:hypothetical protein BHE74_00054050 [Ensete ventricosum]|nr:hypothetical protein BHE74_00054050 [Ensete ventricosum]